MKMRRVIIVLITVLATVFIVGGCINTPAPTSPPTPAPAPTPAPEPEPTPPSAPAPAPTPSPVPEPEPPPEEPEEAEAVQEIRIIMPERDKHSVSATFINTLKAGDMIQGFIEISGEFKTQDWSFDWSVEVIDPEGDTIDIFRGHWRKENHCDLNIEVKDDGEYKIIVRHNSWYDKDLLINIQPKGWS
jgi:hypothetical protein